MKIKHLFLIIAALLTACSPSATKKTPLTVNSLAIPVIDLDAGLKNISNTPFKFSEFIEDIEFVPMETQEKSVLGNGKFAVAILPAPDFVYCDLNKFDLRTGKFIHLVGKRGRGPGEFTMAIGTATDIVTGRVFVLDNWVRAVFIYDKDNNFVKKIEVLPEVQSIGYLGDDNLILFRHAVLGFYPKTVPFEYQIYNIKEDRIINTKELEVLKESVRNSKSKSFSSFGIGRNCDWYFDNKVQFYESFSDTIFTIEKDGKRIPRFFINKKNNKPPFSELIDNESFERNRSKYVEIRSFFETPKFLFLTISRESSTSYYARFDKLTHETKIVSLIGAFENDLSIMKLGSLKNIPGTSNGIEYLDSQVFEDDFLSKMANIPQSEWKEPAKRLYELITKANPGNNGIMCIYKFKNN